MRRDTRQKRRNRPPRWLRGPGKQEREKRHLPPRGEQAPHQMTIFAQAETPREFKQDARLAVMVARRSGLPINVAQVCYDAAQRLLKKDELNGLEFSQVALGVSSLALADLETGRHQADATAGAF